MYQEHTGETSNCVNTNSKTFGTFAVIYDRDSIPAILEWLEVSTKPFDHMFKSISEHGITVRVAYPFVAIQDVRHASQIDQTRTHQDNMAERARIHRWNLSEFCDTNGARLENTEQTTNDGDEAQANDVIPEEVAEDAPVET